MTYSFFGHMRLTNKYHKFMIMLVQLSTVVNILSSHEAAEGKYSLSFPHIGNTVTEQIIKSYISKLLVHLYPYFEYFMDFRSSLNFLDLNLILKYFLNLLS